MECRCHSFYQPPGADEKVDGITKEGGLIALNQVTDKLKDPANYEQGQRPSPIKEEQRKRYNNHRNPDAVRKLIQRMPMLLFVGFNEGHKTSIFGFDL